MTHSTHNRVSAVILLAKSGGALLQHRDNKPGIHFANMWGFPGGQCHEGEDFAVCARREFREETGCDCRSLQWLTKMQVTIPETGLLYEMAVFWDLYDGVQKIVCFEGQEMRFIERKNVSQYAIPDHLIPLWDSALSRTGINPRRTCKPDETLDAIVKEKKS